jgi:N-acyl-D-aspartate/D-glutamate deacylase
VLGLDLAQAIHAMTGRTATAYRVPDRGRLVAGAVADVVVLDPTVVRDGATFGSPRTRPTGIEHVLVAGRFTVRDGAVTGQRPGVMLAAGAPA